MLHKPRHPAARSSSSSSSPPSSSSSSLRRSGSGCKQLERVAGWVSAGLYTAFFTSLDRCSCVKLDTIDNNMQEPTKPLLLPKRPKSKHPSPIQEPLEQHTPTS